MIVLDCSCGQSLKQQISKFVRRMCFQKSLLDEADVGLIWSYLIQLIEGTCWPISKNYSRVYGLKYICILNNVLYKNVFCFKLLSLT